MGKDLTEFMKNGIAEKSADTAVAAPPTTNKHLIRWVEKMADLTQPDRIHWIDGSQAEYDFLCDQLVNAGTFTKLNEKLWPGCFLARSAPNDVARVEDRTFICSLSKDTAGPTNNWEDPYVMRRKLKQLFRGIDARADDVCAAVFDGADRWADVADWRAADGFGLCRGEYADHGADRGSGVCGDR